MEAMAKKENKEYDYEGVFQKIKEIIESIKIN
jgi:hypothetical protein